MKTLIVQNPTQKDIVDYKISEAKIDPDTGDALINTGTGLPAETGRTLEWSIKSGEELEFPAYVARYLKGVFVFLDVKEKTVPEEAVVGEVLGEPEVVVPDTSSGFMCTYCGKSFETKKGLGMHMGRSHAEELSEI